MSNETQSPNEEPTHQTLIECPHCTMPVSENANRCPDCGGNLSKGVAIFAALIGAGLMTLLGLVNVYMLIGVPVALAYAGWVWRRFP